MAKWGPTQQLGCAGVTLGGLLVAAIAIPTLLRQRAAPPTAGPQGARESPPESPPGPSEVIDEQRKLLAEQAAAARDEIQKLHDERIELWKLRLETKADAFVHGETTEYDTIALRNTCDVEVAVALYYRAIDETWVSRGWWTVPAGETVVTDAITRNDPIYFFAENQAAGWLWDGTGREGSVELSVVDEKFDHLADDRFVYANPRRVSFYRRATGKAWIEHVEEFACNAEAPEGTVPPRRQTPVS
jgi:uncharacterized membrane protein